MSICASGASHAKSTSAAAIVVDAAYVRSLLPAGLAWIYPYLPWMHALEIGSVGSFCAIDPPSFTVPTGPQLFSFVTGGPLNDIQVVETFMENVVRAYLWYSLCECTTGSTPAAPSAPSAPANLPAVNPPAVVSLPSTSACATVSGGPTVLASGNFAGLSLALFLSGRAVTSSRLSITVSAIIGSGFTGALRVDWSSVANALLRSDTFAIPSVAGSYTFITGSPPVGAAYAQPVVQGNGSGGSTITTIFEFFCNGDIPGGNQSVCCAPDQTLVARVNQILELVTLIQRQAVPLAYVPKSGGVHAGLSGTGVITVSQILGVQVGLTTVPARAGQIAGTPVTRFDLGWVALGTADGYGPRRFVDCNPMLVRPIEGDVTKIGYTFPADVVATITEYEREP